MPLLNTDPLTPTIFFTIGRCFSQVTANQLFWALPLVSVVLHVRSRDAEGFVKENFFRDQPRSNASGVKSASTLASGSLIRLLITSRPDCRLPSTQDFSLPVLVRQSVARSGSSTSLTGFRQPVLQYLPAILYYIFSHSSCTH